MNVLFVSECSKNALTETRRILDQFAERYGSRTWRTCITQQGLETVKKLLKKTARKNTAVACHRMIGRSGSELLWIVGDANHFDERGITPTNITERDVLRSKDENDWHTATDIKIMAAIAALFHDFGKASQSFQNKLHNNSGKPVKEAYRHEWVSLKLFEAFVAEANDDATWLNKLAMCSQADTQPIKEKLLHEKSLRGQPFKALPRLAKAIGWLIVTHHFLPFLDNTQAKLPNNFLDQLTKEWNKFNEVMPKEEAMCHTFHHGLPFDSAPWCEQAQLWAKQALTSKTLLTKEWLQDSFSLHLARLSLMLGDHYYSSLDTQNKRGVIDYPLYANTYKKSEFKKIQETLKNRLGRIIKHEDEIKDEKVCKQRLDEHLLGVAHYAKSIARTLPNLTKALPRIGHHKLFKQRTKPAKYRWQNEAYDLACNWRDKTKAQGFFGINMASTGCGKTLANARIMYGLADPQQGARFSIALGLRTLTLQTGEVYRQRFKLGSDDLAIVVGSQAVKELFEKKQQNKDNNFIGSESAESLFDDDSYVVYDDALPDNTGLAEYLQKDPNAKKLLFAPILTCTIDHLIGATEGARGGKQIIPMLRLLTSDLVLDEPDDFDIDDLPALTRLVHWAGMLGSRVLLSSATLPPALIEGLFTAYLEGRKQYQAARGMLVQEPKICCAWFDEYGAAPSQHGNPQSFVSAHKEFVAKRIKKLHVKEVYRRATIKDFKINRSDTLYVETAKTFYELAQELHIEHYETDPNTDKRISFGLIRMANIEPLVNVAKEFYTLTIPSDYHVFLCVYHSQYPLLLRSNIEQRLDELLNRENPKNLFNNATYKELIKNVQATNILFIVLASPVAEVGRDHDYSWAIVEPSSMRSIIQLAGRVQRHRQEICQPNQHNIYLLSTNIKSLKNPGKEVTFCKPGFEKKLNSEDHEEPFLLTSHDLNHILKTEEYEVISAIPRITERENLQANTSLVDLEHARLQALMLGAREKDITVQSWWTSPAHLAGQLQKDTPFRQGPPQTTFALQVNKHNLPEFSILENDEFVASNLIENLKPPLEPAANIQPWIAKNEVEQLQEFAEQEEKQQEKKLTEIAERPELDLNDYGRKYAKVELRRGDESNPNTWYYHYLLGIFEKADE